MSFVIPNRGHPRGGVAEAPQLSAPVSATQSNQKSRENIAQYDNQLQSLFFAVLPPEIRTAILSMLLYEGSPTQHIAHFYDGSTRYADGFVRSRCVQQPDSFKHVAEHRNMVKSPWRDGHWHCGRLSTRHSTWRRLKRRLAAKSAAAAAVLYPSPSTCPPPRQSVSLSSGTWSFSPLPTEGSEAPAGSSGGAPHALQFMTAAAANAGPDGPDYPGAENALCSPVPLLLSCRRLHDETADVLYASMTFIGLKPVRYFFREVTNREYLDRIRHITLQWDGILRHESLTPTRYDFGDWEPVCQRLAQLKELATLDVKIFVCERTPARTVQMLLEPVNLVRANAEVTTQIFKDCRNPHVSKNFVAVSIGDSVVPIRVCADSTQP